MIIFHATMHHELSFGACVTQMRGRRQFIVYPKTAGLFRVFKGPICIQSTNAPEMIICAISDGVMKPWERRLVDVLYNISLGSGAPEAKLSKLRISRKSDSTGYPPSFSKCFPRKAAREEAYTCVPERLKVKSYKTNRIFLAREIKERCFQVLEAFLSQRLARLSKGNAFVYTNLDNCK